MARRLTSALNEAGVSIDGQRQIQEVADDLFLTKYRVDKRILRQGAYAYALVSIEGDWSYAVQPCIEDDDVSWVVTRAW
jgi:hypothetical protein